jgi:hypothetical protein
MKRVLACIVTFATIGTCLNSAASQEGPQAIPIDRLSPEVQDIQLQAATANAQDDLPLIPDELFVVGIGPGPSAASGTIADEAELKVLEEAVETIQFDEVDKMWFSQEYGEPLGVDLFCSWAETPQDEKVRESEDATHESGVGLSAAAQAAEEEPEPSDELARNFTVAGRPCTLRRHCIENDAKCDYSYLDSLIARILILQLGE